MKSKGKQLMRMVCLVVISIGLVSLGVSMIQRNSLKSDEAVTNSQMGEERETDIDYMGKYGVPQDGFIEVNIEDPEGMLDYEYLNSLVCYHAKPIEESTELMDAYTDFLWGKQEYSQEEWDLRTLVGDSVPGWDTVISRTNNETGGRIEGSDYKMDYKTGSENLAVEDALKYVKDFCDQFHIGLWKNNENLMYIEDISTRKPMEEVYALKIRLDGLEVNPDLPLMLYRDNDDVLCMMDCKSKMIFKNSVFCEAQSLFSYEITEETSLHTKYHCVEDFKTKIINSSIYSIGREPSVYHLKPLLLQYSVGITKKGTVIYTPWLIFQGECAIYTEEGRWETDDDYVYINLNNGDMSEGGMYTFGY